MTLRLSAIGRRYGDVVAVAGVDLAVTAGTRAAIVGPSGSGKSTLLRIIAGFDAPDAGTVTLDGAILAGPGGFVPAHRRNIGIVTQDGALFPHLSVAENIAFGLPRRDPDRGARVRDLMAMVELDGDLAARAPDALSGGQQQRVALARALARRPRLMLLDEPFSALDTGLRASTRRAVAAVLAAAGVTTILVTHDQAEALSFADQVAVLRRGRLAQAGPPREIYLRPRDREVARFLGDAILMPARIVDGRADCALGRVPVHPPGRAGVAGGVREVMLRPEQIALTDPAGAGITGRVVDVEFQGAACLLDIEVGAIRVALRASALDAPAPGSAVGLVIRGEAHAFDENDGDPVPAAPAPD
mgnify:FL=1